MPYLDEVSFSQFSAHTAFQVERTSMAVQFFLQPHLDERLVGNVPRIGRHFDAVEQVLGQSQRNGFGCGAQVGQLDLLRFCPVHMRSGVM